MIDNTNVATTSVGWGEVPAYEFLVLADQEAVGHGIEELLREAGFVCHLADQPETALVCFEAHPTVNVVIIEAASPCAAHVWLIESLRPQRNQVFVVGSFDRKHAEYWAAPAFDLHLENFWELPELLPRLPNARIANVKLAQPVELP